MPPIKRPNSAGLRPSDVRPSKQPNMATASGSVSTRAEDSVVRQRRTTPAAPPTESAPLAPQRPSERDHRMAISRVLHGSDAPAIPQDERQLLERGSAGALSSVRTAMPADTSHAAGASSQTPLPPGALAEQVKQLGYSPAQMERAVKNYNPTGIYSAILQHTGLLRGLGLSLDDIVKVAGNDGGAQALDALGKYGPGLSQLGYTQADVVQVAGNIGGTQALDALGKHGPALVRLGYSQTDMVRVAGNGGGAQALDALGKHGHGLLQLGYSRTDVVRVAGNSGGAKALAALEELTPTLLAHGFGISELASMGAILASAQKLSLIAEHAGAIRAYNVSPASIMQQATRLRSAAKFQTWLLQQLSYGQISASR